MTVESVESVERGRGVGGEGVEGSGERGRVVRAGGGGDDVRGQLAMMADAEVGELGVEAAPEDGVAAARL
ncbi:hypothetical protein ABZY45_19790 [Streptomyces sp. NPDC006516]|uniref:hypothetical protein n=1 Tax=Streptomyces sp. NPDC006516 TaxID=3154309 RepID=UPI00339FFEB1